mgnify:CR=1 FL=1
MNCIYCGTPLAGIDYCTGCGADITLQKRIGRISNLLYNEGLEKATVRDLSGAIVCLKRSLKFNKENVDARNLLGLVYFETGEVVSALSEWVISKNMNVPHNAADFYIEQLQANKNKLDTINQTIRKYNQALVYCRQDNDDMAVIQLKKVLAQNPKFIKAYHLLSLLYLKQQEYEKARKLLRKAAYIDTTNTKTLRYLKEVEAATGISTSLDVKRKKRYAKEKVNKLTGTMTYMNGNEMIIQPTTFRDSSTVATFLNIFLGLILGGAIVYFLIVPGTKQSIHESANQQVTAANSKMAAEAARVQGLQEEIEAYQAKVQEAEDTMDEADRKAESYDEILAAAKLYLDGDQTGVAESLASIDQDTMSGAGKELYDALSEAVGDAVYQAARSVADTAYLQGDYDTAVENYLKALDAKEDDYEAMLYLGFSYYRQGDTAKSNEIFQEIVQKFPAQAATVQGYITEDETGSQGSRETDESETGDGQETDESETEEGLETDESETGDTSQTEEDASEGQGTTTGVDRTLDSPGSRTGSGSTPQ